MENRTEELFYSYDIANILQVTLGSVQYALRKLKIKGHLLCGDRGHRTVYTKKDIDILQDYYKQKEKDVCEKDDNHPLVKDKRFLKLSFWPDVSLAEDE